MVSENAVEVVNFQEVLIWHIGFVYMYVFLILYHFNLIVIAIIIYTAFKGGENNIIY